MVDKSHVNVLVKPVPTIIRVEISARNWFFNNHITEYKNITFYHMTNGKCIAFSYKLTKYIVQNTIKAL